MQLSAHFTLEEMVHSQAALRLGLDNTPTPAQIGELTRLCGTLEQVRSLLGCPLRTDSGFRSPAVNRAVGSTAKHSDHMDGRAHDGIPLGVNLGVAFDEIRRSTIAFDKLILECDAWLHLSIAPVGLGARRLCMIASGGPGNWIYSTAM